MAVLDLPSGQRASPRTPLLTSADKMYYNAETCNHEGEIVPADVESSLPTSEGRCWYMLHYGRILSLMRSPITDEKDSPKYIIAGLSTMLLCGGVLGLLMPKNDALESPLYRSISSMIGFTCFACWSVSFYPQIINNYRRGSTQGLSADFCCLNVLGFACYAIYNLSMYNSATIHAEYRARYGPEVDIAVQSNDVAFAVHSLIMATITFLQMGYYDGFRKQRPSGLVSGFILLVVIVATLYPLCLLMGVRGYNWLDYVYLLSFVKIIITLIKYIPQIKLNHKRKSTKGFSIWQILLDFSGGVLNDLQLVLDSLYLDDWSGITGNPAKLCLGVFSIFFDLIFMTQHYILYSNEETPTMSLPMSSEYQKRRRVSEDQESELLIV